MKDINEQQNNIINNNKQLNNLLENLELESILIQIEQIHSNQKPDDLEPIKAYDSLNRLNNYLTSLKKNYLEAKPFLQISDNDFAKLNYNFNELKQLIGQYNYQNVDIQKALLESLRDFNVCTQKDFVKEYNLQIQDRSQDDFSYSSHKDKNKFIKPISNLVQQDISLVQLSNDWEYYDYPPILKQECQEELPMIKQDILQFQKIQALNSFQTNKQRSYDLLIEKVLSIKIDFVNYAKKGKDIMEKFDFTKRLRFFNDYPKNAKNNNNPEIVELFDKIHEFINKLGTFDKQQSACIWLYHYDQSSFQQIKQDQLILNDYLNKRFNYKMSEVEMELNQLYRDFKICTGKSYFEQPSQSHYLDNNHQNNHNGGIELDNRLRSGVQREILKKSQIKQERKEEINKDKQVKLQGQRSKFNFVHHKKRKNQKKKK